jgi:hypothetical protein
MRRGAKSKKTCQTMHAQKRAVERYGFYPEPASIRHIVEQIQTNRAKLVCRQSRRVSVWDVVSLSDVPCRVVYDRVRKNIVTFLPIQEEPTLATILED